MNHKDFVELSEKNKIIIGVDRAMARKLYTDIPIQEIRDETGESLYFEKLVVYFAFIFGPISVFASIVVGFLFFNWWGVILLILCPIIYFIYAGESARGGSRMTVISVLLSISASIYFFGLLDNTKVVVLVTIFIFSLWCARLVYSSSSVFLRNFVIRNEKAYRYLSQYFVIEPCADKIEKPQWQIEAEKELPPKDYSPIARMERILQWIPKQANLNEEHRIKNKKRR